MPRALWVAANAGGGLGDFVREDWIYSFHFLNDVFFFVDEFLFYFFLQGWLMFLKRLVQWY